MGNELKDYVQKPLKVQAYQWDGQPNDDIIRLDDSGQILTAMQYGRNLGWFKSLGAAAAVQKGRIVKIGDYVVIDQDGVKTHKTKEEFEAGFELAEALEEPESGNEELAELLEAEQSPVQKPQNSPVQSNKPPVRAGAAHGKANKR